MAGWRGLTPLALNPLFGSAGAGSEFYDPAVLATSRIVAGGPIEGGIFKCALQPVDRAIRRGLYAPWLPSADEVARLQQIFPTGVCDYSKPDVGRPRGGSD